MAEMHKTSDNRGSGKELYLLFAGRHGDSAQGMGSLVATFASQDEARAAFRQTRLNLSDAEGWAELSVVSAGRRARMVSWFGADRKSRATPLTGLLDDGPPPPPTRRRARLALRRRRHGTPGSTDRALPRAHRDGSSPGSRR